MNEIDKGLARELDQLGIKRPTRPLMLPQDESRDLGATCRVCGTRRVVYTITKALGPAFLAGGYCYDHLVKQCQISGCIPYPIDQALLDRVKASLGLKPWDTANLTFRVE